jgi:hypothetical protein
MERLNHFLGCQHPGGDIRCHHQWHLDASFSKDGSTVLGNDFESKISSRIGHAPLSLKTPANCREHLTQFF